MEDQPVPERIGRVGRMARRALRRQRRRRHRLVVFSAVAASLVTTMIALWFAGSTPPSMDVPAPPAVRQSASTAGTVTVPSELRPVFRYSIVPGGVYTVGEVELAMRQDDVVAAHYAKVDAKTLRVEFLREPRWAYVSYRVGNKVFWTRNKVKLSAGEQILSDGQTTIRARCGNCISGDALEPVAETGVDPDELDLLGDPAVMVAQVERPQMGLPRMPFPIGPAITLTEPADDPRADPRSLPPIGLPGTRRPGDSGDPFPTGTGDPWLPPPNPPAPIPPPPTPPGPDPSPDPEPDDPPDPGAPLPVPEPATIVLVGIGAAAGLARHLRNRRQRHD